MSLDQARAFIDKVKSDKAFHDQIMSMEGPDQRLEHVHKVGFDCTAEEIKQVSEELSEEDLDQVAGGGFFSSAWNFFSSGPSEIFHGIKNGNWLETGEGILKTGVDDD